jgi:Hr1 repeat
MLQQLEFKLNVEQKYKEGMDKLVKLYQMEGDRKARAETETKRSESAQKIVLLKQALKRYGNLDVSIVDEDQRDGLSPQLLPLPFLQKYY